MDTSEELVQLVLKGDCQYLNEVASSRVYGWRKQLRDSDPSEIADDVAELELPEDLANEVVAYCLQGILDDIDEHAEDSEFFADREEIEQQLNTLAANAAKIGPYPFSYLASIAEDMEDGMMTFLIDAVDFIEDENARAFVEKLRQAEYRDQADIIKEQNDFSGFTELVDEIVASQIAYWVNWCAANEKNFQRADETIAAFEYYLEHRPFPQCFGTSLVTAAAWLVYRKPKMTALAQRLITKLLPHTYPNVMLYTRLAYFYSAQEMRDELIDAIKKAVEFGVDDFFWANFYPWEKDEAIQALIPD